MGCSSSNQAKNVAYSGKPEVQSTAATAAAANLPHTLEARYKLGAVLGEGGFSIVKKATSRINGEVVAVKIVQRADLSIEGEESLRNEVKILSELKHKNITRLVDFFEEEKYFYVVLEYLDGGELFDRIAQKSFYNEKEARDIVVTLLETIRFIHDHDIVHRDLKPENLLLTSQCDDADFHVKVADFGFATQAKGLSITSQYGSPGYIAPEILTSTPYGKPADMWSLGVVLYVLLGGCAPFHAPNQRALFRFIVRGDFQFSNSNSDDNDCWRYVSQHAKDLIQALLNVDQNARLTVQQALSHPWLQQSAAELATHDLHNSLLSLRKFQTTRKLRSAVHTVDLDTDDATAAVVDDSGAAADGGASVATATAAVDDTAAVDGDRGGVRSGGDRSGGDSTAVAMTAADAADSEEMTAVVESPTQQQHQQPQQQHQQQQQQQQDDDDDGEENEATAATAYRFGDVTRGIIARGKEKDGRSSNDGYKFGDFTRGLLR